MQSAPRPPSTPTTAYIAACTALTVFAFLGHRAATETRAEAAPAPEVWPSLPLPTFLAETAPAPAPRDTRVLIIGDSHVTQTYGQALDLLLRARARTRVTTVGSCGVSPDGFLTGKTTRCGFLHIDGPDMTVELERRSSTPQVDDLLAEHRPDVTVIELGANLIWRAQREPEAAAAQIRTLAEKVAASSTCVWVGPPNGTDRKKPSALIDDVYRLLEQNLPAGCTFMDSRTAALPFLDYADLARQAKRRGDGRHFDNIGIIGRQAARRWALATYEFLLPHLDGTKTAAASTSTHRLAQR